MRVYEMIIIDDAKNEVTKFYINEFEVMLKSITDLVPYIDRVRDLGYFVNQINVLEMIMEEYVKLPTCFLSKKIHEGVKVKN